MGEQPVPPQEPSVDPFLAASRLPLTRREVDALAALGLAGSLLDGYSKWEVGIDVWTQKAFPYTKPKIDVVMDVPVERRTPSLPPMLVFGGLGCQYATDIAQTYAQSLRDMGEPYRRVGGICYGNGGVSDDDNAALTKKFTEGYPTFDIMGHSMGLITALKAARSMQGQRIGRIIALSSPTSIADVFRRHEVEMAVQTGIGRNIFEKVVANVVTDHRSDRRGFLARAIDVGARALYNASIGTSPKVYGDQLESVLNDDVSTLMLELVELGVIDEETMLLYFWSPHDLTVIPGQARDNCHRACEVAKVGFMADKIDGKHADINAACAVMRKKSLL